jgi:hypothetical protein
MKTIQTCQFKLLTTFVRSKSTQPPLLLSLLLLAACGGNSHHHNDSNTRLETPNPLIENVAIDDKHKPFISSTSFDLGEFNYESSEYFISGTASSFINSNNFQPDGYWHISHNEQAPFKTRIVVYRPADNSDFNGTVIIEWLNVSAGLDAAPGWIMAHTELIDKGYAWVGVSAQLDGVEGRENALIDLSLKSANNLERYASLQHPGDSFSYDIFSQAAQAVRHPQQINPLEGLDIRRMIASGQSQSASRLLTYVNTIAPLSDLFDAYFIHSRLGGSAALSQHPQAPVPTPDAVQVRDDLSQPVMMLQTETDLFLLGSAADRQADSDKFRLWEVAGTAHADLYTLQGISDKGDQPAIAAVQEVSSPVPGIINCSQPINSGPQHFVVKAALSALDNWLRTAASPPEAPRLELTEDLSALLLDEHGNSRGGIRTPYVDVPIASFSGEGGGDGFCFLFGSTLLFEAEKNLSLYGNHASYVAAVELSTAKALAAGFILPAAGELIIAAAQASDLGI